MKIHPIISALCLCLILFSSDRSFAQGQPRTVLDYFDLLPRHFFEAPEVRTKWIKRPSSIIDVKNGYLHLKGDGAQSDLTICLFKTKTGGYVIAVHSASPDDNVLKYYNYDGAWHDITTKLLPKQFDLKILQTYNRNFEYSVQLPRYGTTIRITNSNNRIVHTLSWNRTSFTLTK